MSEGLIDEYRLVVCPVVLGSGRPLFRDAVDTREMKFVETKAFDRGAVLLKYTSTKAPSADTRDGETSMLRHAPIIPYIPVADVNRARKFYEGKLGLKPKEEYAGGVVYEFGKGSRVFMYPSAGAGTSKASTAFWAVDDIVSE